MNQERLASLLLGWMTAKQSCPCKHPAYPATGGGSKVTFKPMVPKIGVREGFLTLTSPKRRETGRRLLTPCQGALIGVVKRRFLLTCQIGYLPVDSPSNGSLALPT
ncbi:hypothetical protein J6590_057068 [Homalodisca vitripennis]|nr:hypothetical protein J6590_057068 [Homalodisca vitripennis]